MELGISGFNTPDKDGIVPVNLTWRFRNTGGSALTVKDVMFGVRAGEALPEIMPDGAIFDGSGIVVINSITSAFSPKDPIPMQVPKAQADAAMNGSLNVFFLLVSSIGTPCTPNMQNALGDNFFSKMEAVISLRQAVAQPTNATIKAPNIHRQRLS